MTSNKKILLLGGGFSTNNLGVWALSSGAITSILHTYPHAKIYFLDYHSQPAIYSVRHPHGTCSAELINIRFSKKFWLKNNIARLLLTALIIKLIPFCSVRNRLVSRNYWLRHIQTSDIIGSIAGGDSFSDIYGLGRLIYVTLPLILVLLLGRPLVLLPQTYGPFKSVFTRAIAKYILRRSSMIFSRDNEGLETAHHTIGGDYAKLRFCCDMGFVLEPHIEKERIPKCLESLERVVPLVGLNVSGLLYMGGYTRNNMFGLKADYRIFIRDIIESFINKYNAQVLLVPHVFGGGDKAESDLVACRSIYNATKNRLRVNVHLIDQEYDQHEIKAIIGQCDFFLGSRMHACIAAISQCVPTVGLAYSRKFHGVFSTVGMEALVIDIREHDVSTVIAAVDRAYQCRQDLRGELETRIPPVRASVLSLFRQISLDLDQNEGGDYDIQKTTEEQIQDRIMQIGR